MPINPIKPRSLVRHGQSRVSNGRVARPLTGG